MKKLVLIILTCTVGKNFAQVVDTVKVNQSDTLIFNTNMTWIQRPCQKPEWNISYEIKKPKDSTYYLIYNDNGQLTKEGLYISSYKIDSVEYSGFYYSRFYYYRKNGRLSDIVYQLNGRNAKTEYYKRGKLKETKIIN